MCKGLIGKKLGMTSIFSPEGEYLPVTVLQVGPCVVTQVKTEKRDGYNALQLGFEEKKEIRTTKPLKGHFRKSGKGYFKFLKEMSVSNPGQYNAGQIIDANLFQIGDKINITGQTKGCGFAGVIKRHNFHGGKKTHGSHSHRIPGSIGCSAWPAKVIKGKKMPGQHGNVRRTVKNLQIIDIIKEDNLIMIKGSVPGYRSQVVLIKKSGR